ncbi:MAG: hypothetical protein ABI624_04495 [Casimicrobiaceae bacterium]
MSAQDKSHPNQIGQWRLELQQSRGAPVGERDIERGGPQSAGDGHDDEVMSHLIRR